MSSVYMRARSLIAVLALTLFGCSTVEPAPGMSSEGLSGSVGVLHVERSMVDEGSLDAYPEHGDPEGSTVLRAAFARYHGIEGDSVLRLLGSHAAAELEQCTMVDPAGALGADDADVELLDVGALHVSVADTEVRLVPRTFPDLASVLAGVFYAGDAELASPEPEVDEYRFLADGSVEVGAFDVVVPSPAAPSGLTLVGADGTSATLDGRLTEVTTSGALTFVWDAEDPRDLVEIEIASAGQTLSCLARDEGSFGVDAEWLGMLPPDADARLTVRRVRLSPFDAEGMDYAFARVAAARSYPLSIR